MTRTRFAREFCEQAHRRAREKRDRGKREGPDHQNGVGARKFDQLGGQINPKNTPRDSLGQLTDRDFFAKCKRADCRIRDIVADDGLGAAASDLLRVIVARGGKKTFVWREAQL